MRTLSRLSLLLVLAAGVAWAGTRVWSISQNLTGTAPSADCSSSDRSTTNSTCGFDVTGMKAVRICAQAASGQTLSGAGAVNVWVYNIRTNSWGLDQEMQLAVNAVGTPRMQCWTRDVTVPIGRLYPVPSGITVSGGTTVTTSVEGWY